MKSVSFIACCTIALALSACAPKYKLSPDRGRAEHVVLMVWDGMRPDLVTEENTPTLWKLARDGVTFSNHHPVYPSTTEVNGAALATGGYPARSGIVGNREFRPAIDARKAVGTESVETVRKGDAIGGGKYLGLPTVAELIQQAGFRTAVAGTKPVAFLMDRAAVRTTKGARASVAVFQGETAPANASFGIVRGQGAFPGAAIPNAEQDLWTTKVLTGELWKDGVPKFSMLWMSDPDFSQHNWAPGAPGALQALRNSDGKLAMLLASLDAKGVREKTDVFVVSDHGFSTISDSVDVAQALADAGFRAARQFIAPPQAGEIMVVNTGASLLLYVTNHDAATVERLVDFLQRSPFAGVIFTRAPMAGTFALSVAHLDSPNAPDVVLSLRWTDAKNEFGVPGMLHADFGRKAGQGMHGTLSPFDMHNTLIAAGPDFPKGAIETLPTGNVDVAPTILWILGVRPTAPVNGRVVVAPPGGRAALTAPEETVLEANRDLGAGQWRQYLREVRCGDATYFLEGNGHLQE